MSLQALNYLSKYNTKFTKIKPKFISQASVIFNNTNLFSKAPHLKTNNLYSLVTYSEKVSRLFFSYLKSKKKRSFFEFKNFLGLKNIILNLKKPLKFLNLKKRKKILNIFKIFSFTTLLGYFKNNLKLNKFLKLFLNYKKLKIKHGLINNIKKKKTKIEFHVPSSFNKSDTIYMYNVYKWKIILAKRRKRKNAERFEILGQEILNTLKNKLNFQHNFSKSLKYSKVFFKYTGSNIFATITTKEGNVLYSYSSGFFKGLRTRKEKTTIFVSKQLGELVAITLYKLNAKEVFFIPFINHRKARTLMRYMVKGFRVIRTFKFINLFVKIHVMRNGVRLRKAPRK